METTLYIKASHQEINNLFNNSTKINIRFYKFIEPNKCKALIRHSDEVKLKKNSCYTINGILKKYN